MAICLCEVCEMHAEVMNDRDEEDVDDDDDDGDQGLPTDCQERGGRERII